MQIQILFEDENILVINKPSGISVHQSINDKNYSICDWVLENYPEIKEVGEPIGEIARPGIVHRLDRETSGVLILAKNNQAHAFLKKQFQNQEVEKTYLALVCGELKKDFGVIDAPIGRSPNDFRRRLAGRGARGELREAKTEFKKIKTVEIDNQKYTLVEVHPKTGRTHQIRVHMKYLSYPVVCDRLYAPSNICPLEFGRLMLHARKIKFQNLNGEILEISAPLPEIFEKLS